MSMKIYVVVGAQSGCIEDTEVFLDEEKALAYEKELRGEYGMPENSEDDGQSNDCVILQECTITEKAEWEEIGKVGVDSSLLMICDPLYIENQHALQPDAIMEAVDDERPAILEIPYNLGHKGAGIVISSGLGDGYYPVSIRRETSPEWGERIAEVRVKFLPHPSGI